MKTTEAPLEAGALARLCRAFERLAMILVGLMVTLVLMQIVGRDLVGAGWSWADELARYCGLGVVYLTVPLLLLRDKHIRVDLLSARLRGSAARVVRVLDELLTLGFASLFLWGAWAFMQRASKFSTPALGLPNWLFYLPAMLGMLLFAVVAARRLAASLRLERPSS